MEVGPYDPNLQNGRFPPSPPPRRKSPENMGPKGNRDSAHEAAGLLHPNEMVQRKHHTLLPAWLRKKRYFVLLIAVLLGAGTVLAVLGALGKLGDLGKKKPESTAPKDGVRIPDSVIVSP